ncbi:hypothetical protein M3223_16190 [Paenibacillus pasadenensis]|uniref:hypothetical protein n=1 Tax=Paenibacillus pasadenensis TaxID=217090 RepID=UPI0020415EFE|nr:hypothetical protein [Paenibacillus pasadenensis]MCM3748895.1 hypothetical protein [Paenibacillus pasadenensis]
MWSIWLIVLSAGGIVAVEFPLLKRRKYKREILAFAALLLFGVGLGIAKALELDIPNPIDWISVIYKPLSELLYGKSA